MANMPNSKISLLYIMKALIEKTDEAHALSTEDLIAYLAENNLEAEDKKVRRDLEVLREFGFDIDYRGRHRYYLATRPLEFDELTMLVDALQSSPALTEEMTDFLIGRLEAFVSESQREQLDRRIDVPGRIKMENQGVLGNVDIIQDAMRRGKQVSFRYREYNDDCKLVLRRDKPYTYTPLSLVYVDEYYYLMCFNAYFAEKEGGRWANPYRVDRMVEVQVSDEDAVHHPLVSSFRLGEQVTPSFGVYAADMKTVKLQFRETAGRKNAQGWPLRSPMNVIVDKFGQDVQVYRGEDGIVTVVAKAPSSPQFWGWLMEINASENAAGVKLVYPSEEVETYKGWLKAQLETYGEQE